MKEIIIEGDERHGTFDGVEEDQVEWFREINRILIANLDRCKVYGNEWNYPCDRADLEENLGNLEGLAGFSLRVLTGDEELYDTLVERLVWFKLKFKNVPS